MVAYYISLRLKQFWRFFRFNQFHPVLGIVLAVAIFAAVSFAWFEKLPYAGRSFAGIAFLSLMELQPVNSNKFLAQQVTRTDYFKAKLAENALLSLPFLVVFILQQEYVPAIVLLSIVIPYSRYNFKIARPKLRALKSPYPAHSLEWHNSFRSFVVVYLLHACLLIPGVISRNFYVYLVPFFLLLFFLNTVYAVVEDKSYIWLYRSSASSFLLKKTKTMAASYFSTVALFLIAGVAFYPSQAGMLAICAVAGFICLLGSLFIKYHFYPVEFVIQISQMVFMGLTLGGLANPSLFLLSILMLIFSYFKARNRLKSILQC